MPPPRSSGMRVALRALRRYRWWILILWGVMSAGLIGLILMRIKPSYEARAWLKVDPVATSVSMQDLDLFRQTQVQLLTSPGVLGKALTDPEVKSLEWVRRDPDSQTRLRELLQVTAPSQTALILVSMASPRREEAARVVNAVVRTYLEAASTWSEQDARKQTEQLEALRTRYRADIDRYRRELEEIVTRTGGTDPNAPQHVEAERYRQYRVRLGNIELDRMEAEAAADALRNAPNRAESTTATDPRAIEQLVEQAFRADPEVATLHDEMKQVQIALRDAERRSRNPDSSAIQRYRRRIEELSAENERLWSAKKSDLRARYSEPGAAVAKNLPSAELGAAELRLAKLRNEENKVRAEADAIRKESHDEGGDTLRVQFLTSELNSATELDHRVALRLDQLRAESHGVARVSQIGTVQPPSRPTHDPRPVLIATVPVAVMMTLVGLFVLFEARAARVTDPDDVAARLKLTVIGIVPPLPSRQPVQGTRALQDQRRRVDEFIQSLDHLRVALYASARSGERRCVMITSAMPGEGKTTLAAQLAGRCANAGLTTLLIDADLRRPALGRLLDIPEGPGLSEVLAGEADPEEAMIIVSNAGGFHLLPAGGGADPNRLLQSDRLGQLIARVRATFDVVLIDCPPVLPVPDALQIGRWTDGAVLAVRHDSSRFPLVERARRRLAAVGIPVLGAVINGCRPDASSYGAYGSYESRDGVSTDHDADPY